MTMLRGFAAFAFAIFASTATPARAAAATSGANMSAESYRRVALPDGAVVYGSAVDGLGNTYLGGFATNPEKGDDDFLAVKVDPSGAVVWTATYDHGGEEAWDWGYAVGLDAAGNVYVFGESWNGMDNDLEVVKFDPAGNLLWARVLNSGGDDRASTAAVDAAGNVYATSIVRDFLDYGNQIDAVLTRWDSDGNLLWQRVYEAGVNEWANGVAVGVDGSVSVGVSASTHDGYGNWSQFVSTVLRYSPAGDLLWSWSQPRTEQASWGEWVAVGSDGSTYTTTFDTNGVDDDAVTTRLDASGAPVWARIFDLGGWERPAGIAVDGAGNVFVSLSASDAAGARQVTLRYSASGKLEWSGDWAGGPGMGIAAEPVGAGFTLAGNGWAAPGTVIRYVQTDFQISRNSPPQAILGESYNHFLKASGGMEPYQWAVVDDALPDGLSLNAATGRITGTPTKVQARSVVVEARDATGARVVDRFALSVYAPLVVLNSELPPAVAGTPYGALLSAVGGGWYRTWTVASGGLPPGVALATDGSLSGTPEALGTFPVTVQVTDELGLTATRAFTLLVDSIDVGPALLADGILGLPYEQLLVPFQGTAPLSWSIAGGALPSGLALDQASGLIAGVPQSAGTSVFDVLVADAGGLSGTRARQLEVNDLAEAWRLSPPPDVEGYIAGVGLDAAGNSYVRADSYLPTGGYELSITKRDPSGQLVWRSRWVPAGRPAGSPVAAVASDGSEVVGITTFGDGYYSTEVASFGPDGLLRWSRSAGTTPSGAGLGVAIGSGGESYVASAASLVIDGTSRDAFSLTAFDPAGNLRWSRQYEGFVSGPIAIDAQGALYVAAGASDRDGSYAVLLKLDAEGNLLWSRSFGNGYARVWYARLTVASNGTVIAAGGSYHARDGYDVFVNAYDGSGASVWSAVVDRTSYVEYVYGLAVDEGGNAYLSSHAYWLPFPGQTIVKFDPDGRRVWTKSLDLGPADLAVDSTGSVVVAGSGVVARFVPSR